MELKQSVKYVPRWMSIWVLVGLVFVPGCAGLRYQEPGLNDERTIQELHRRLFDRPEDAFASRDLGAAYIRMQQPATARPYLEDAFSQLPADPKTLFYMGLLTEMEVGMQEALPFYDQHTVIPASSSYRKLMRGRWQWISQELIRDELRLRIAQEDSLQGQGVDSRALAVFPLQFNGLDSNFVHLGRAFSELVISDLALVPSLKLVERVRIQTLLDELDLVTQDLTDPSASPRLGHLLGAGHLTGGRISMFADQSLQIDFASWKPAEQTNPAFLRHGGRLAHFFDIEKEVVFSLLRSLEIELTPEEQERIQRIPTQNMQAFLAYSRGLMHEDRGFYIQATEAYQEAVSLDPGFQQAREAAERTSDAAAGSGTASNVIENVNEMESGDGASQPIDLLGLRMSILTGSGGAGSSTEEDRQPASEAASAGDPILADPPPPPNN